MDLRLKVFSDIASRTINRIGMLTFFGPLYGLFILSSFAMRGTMYGFNDEPKKETDTKDNQNQKKKDFLKRNFLEKFLHSFLFKRFLIN